MGLAIRVVTEPAEEPLSLVDAKAQCRITGDDDDDLVATYITAARQHLEETRGRAYVTQTRELQLDAFPCRAPIEIPRAPLQSVTWIKYYDYGGTLQTWDSALYQVDTMSEPGRILPVYGLIYPYPRPQLGAVTIRYVAGYGAAVAVPERVRQALRLLVADMWENRSPVVLGVSVSTRNTVDALLPTSEALWIGQ